MQVARAESRGNSLAIKQTGAAPEWRFERFFG